MPRHTRPRREPTDDYQQLSLWAKGPEHCAFELIRLVVKRTSSTTGSKLLGAIGTREVIDPLLEMFRTATPSKIQPDGTMVTGRVGEPDDFGEDAEPAYVLVQLPGGIAELKARCSPDEFERILLIAYNGGVRDNPEIHDALGELATPRTITQLIRSLASPRDTPWGARRIQLAQHALILAGKKAHPQLLAALQRQQTVERGRKANEGGGHGDDEHDQQGNSNE
jgi:hypothetical protein